MISECEILKSTDLNSSSLLKSHQQNVHAQTATGIDRDLLKVLVHQQMHMSLPQKSKELRGLKIK